MRAWFSIFFGFLMGMTLSGCGDSGGSSGGGRLVPPGYDEKACSSQKPDEGPNALFNNLNQTSFVLGPLQKPYDRYDLEAVLDASSVSTTEYVKSLGVQLFRIPRADLAGACQTFYNLAPAPADLEATWNRASGGVSGNFRLAGLYWDNCGNSCREFSVVKPTILVDEASDRWTLVHEMMHYNFNQGRAADRSRPSYYALNLQMRRSLMIIERSLQSLSEAANEADLEKAARESEVLANTAYLINVNSIFEEVALEALLIREWAEGRFIHKNAWAPQSSLKYMESARRQGLSNLGKVTELSQRLRKVAEQNSWTNSLPFLERADIKIKLAADETQDLIRDSRRLVNEKLNGESRSKSGDNDWQSLDIHSHRHLDQLEGSEALKEMSNRLKKMKELYKL